jgi:hypothetical protein
MGISTGQENHDITAIISHVSLKAHIDDEDVDEDVEVKADGEESFVPENGLDDERTAEEDIAAAVDDDAYGDGDDEENSYEVGKDK